VPHRNASHAHVQYRFNLPNSRTTTPLFLSYIHSFRAVAIVAVVAAHVLNGLAWPEDGPSLVHRVTRALVQNATALFLFVAGFLFQHLSQRFQYRKYLKSKLIHVILPYVVVSIPALVLRYRWGFYEGHDGSVLDIVEYSVRQVVTGEHHPAPFWFIPMIAVIYLAAPLLIFVDRHPRLYYFLPFTIVVAMLCHRPLHLTSVGHSLIYFTPAYVSGMWLSHYRERALAFFDRYFVVLALASTAAMAIDLFVFDSSGAIFSRAPFSTENGIVGVDLPVKLIWGILLIAFLRRHDETFRRPLAYLAGASFGVFFIHIFVIDALDVVAHRMFTTGLPPGWMGIVIFTPLVTAVSLALVWMVRAVLGSRSRYVIGC
jgi:probable poly-beta-1,6-N-acetyl-D-glucosamine export protein